MDGNTSVKYLQQYIKEKDYNPEMKNDYFLKLSEEVGELACFLYFGNSQAEELNHAYKLKADGAKYCDCPVCTAALDILEKKYEILNKV